MEENLPELYLDEKMFDESIKEAQKYSLSELKPDEATGGGLQKVSMFQLYDLKNFDHSKTRFAENALVSKVYEKSLEKNLSRWKSFFKLK